MTRIPKELRRRLKLHCAETDTTIQDFTRVAISEEINRKALRRRGRSSAARR